MSGVRIAGLVKEFGGSTAVEHLDLDIAPGEFVTLLGPSGCGKTTTLRCLAGLEVPTRGEISIADRVVYSDTAGTFVPPDKRDIGMVFQSYGLWPHMTVAGNVGYPLKLAKVAKAQAREQVADMLGRVGLAERIDQMATSLSGGQQQRVALARAMVNRPTLMLFDEPLSNLDAKLRLSMRAQIRELHDSLGTTSVYVTHDQEEAIALADRVVVMNTGLIEQVGTPRELYRHPASAMAGAAPGPVGTPVAVAFRASHVCVNADRSADATRLTGRIQASTYLGSCMRVLVDLGGALVRAQVDEGELHRFGPDDLSPGHEVTLSVPAGQVVGLPGDDGATGTPAPRVAATVTG
jgi:iron(III) transport system ATP-binding protein